MTALLLVAHGSRDATAQQMTEEIAVAVSAQLRDVSVGVGYLELATPTVAEALDRLAGTVVVQPLLFAPAYHATTDLPGQLVARRNILLGRVLAPDPLLYEALDRRLAEVVDGQSAPDGLVLASAGTSSASARKLLHQVAREWADRYGRPGLAGFASATPLAGDAVRSLHKAGCRRVAVGSLFISPGRLPRAARESALSGGAIAVAAPLGPCPELIRLLVRRFAEALVARATA